MTTKLYMGKYSARENFWQTVRVKTIGKEKFDE